MSDHGVTQQEFVARVGGWQEGLLRAPESVVEGLERAPEAFIGMVHGANTGKTVVRL